MADDGPTADRIAFTSREQAIAEIEGRLAALRRAIGKQADLLASALEAELSRLRNEQPRDKTDEWDREHAKSRVIVQDENGRFEAIDKHAPSPATSPGSQDVRAREAVRRIECECFYWEDRLFNSERAYHIILAALAQSDAQPVGVERLLLFAYHMDKEAEREFAVRDMAPTEQALYTTPPSLPEGAREAAEIPGLEAAISVLACEGTFDMRSVEKAISSEINRIRASAADRGAT